MDQISPSSKATQIRDSRRRRFAYFCMIASVLIFGSNFVVSRYAVLNGLTVHDLMALRFGTAGLILLPLFLKDRLIQRVGWPRATFLAASSGFPLSLLMLSGLSLAPAAHGATITPGTVTIIGIIGGVVMFGAAVTRSLVVGIVCMLAGLACLAFSGSTSGGQGTLTGDLLFLCAGLVWGGYPLAIQRWNIDGLRATAIVAVLSLVYLPVYALFFFRGVDIAPWWVLVLHALYQGVLNVILGLWMWGLAAHVLGQSVVGRFPPLIPVTGTLLAIPLLGEVPAPLQWLGIALIVGGLFVTSWRRPRRAAG